METTEELQHKKLKQFFENNDISGFYKLGNNYAKLVKIYGVEFEKVPQLAQYESLTFFAAHIYKHGDFDVNQYLITSFDDIQQNEILKNNSKWTKASKADLARFLKASKKKVEDDFNYFLNYEQKYP